MYPATPAAMIMSIGSILNLKVAMKAMAKII